MGVFNWGEDHLTGACPVKFFVEKERSLPRETYLSFLFNWGGFNWGRLTKMKRLAISRVEHLLPGF